MTPARNIGNGSSNIVHFYGASFWLSNSVKPTEATRDLVRSKHCDASAQHGCGVSCSTASFAWKLHLNIHLENRQANLIVLRGPPAPGCKSDLLFFLLPNIHPSVAFVAYIHHDLHYYLTAYASFRRVADTIYSQRSGLTYAHSEYRLALRFPFSSLFRFEKSLESGHVFLLGQCLPISMLALCVGLVSLSPS
jgi:hypothetical protein